MHIFVKKFLYPSLSASECSSRCGLCDLCFSVVQEIRYKGGSPDLAEASDKGCSLHWGQNFTWVFILISKGRL